jgi:3'-5' exoribonuclease
MFGPVSYSTSTARVAAMPTPPPLKHLAVGARVQDPLLVLDVERKSYGGDRDCVVLVLGNPEGRIATAPFWGADQDQVAGIAPGDVVQVIGFVASFRDRRQLKVTSIRVLPKDGIDPRALLPSVGDVTRYWERLDRWRGEIRRARLAHTLALFYDDPEFRRRYELCPASLNGHHAALGGLLRHTYEVAVIGRAIGRVSGADADLVLAGVLLHDIGKLEAYRWDGVFAMTERGSLLGHVTLGALMLERRLTTEEPPTCTEQERGLLHHLILSHHGKPEFGAPVAPMTLEAEVLHYADNASAKTATMAQALADPDNFRGDEPVSSRPIWELEKRRGYRGKSDWGEHD